MNKKENNYSCAQTTWLVILRIAIGWHFLYEGLHKLIITPGWTSRHYLEDSEGWFSELFQDMAASEAYLNVVDTINIWGLVLIGLGLIFGCMSKYASIAGIGMLSLYFVSHIPFIGASYLMPAEGSYLWLDKNIIEICALMVLIFFPTSHIIGLDRFFCHKCKKQKAI